MAAEQPDKVGKSQWNDAEWGPMAKRIFDKCPGCGCPSRYAVEALRGEIPDEVIQNKPPAIGSFEFVYDTEVWRIKLTVIVDSCCKCGTLYTVARNKSKTLLIMVPRTRGPSRGG